MSIVDSTGAIATQGLRVVNSGNVLISTTTDNGAKLQVNGSATFASSVTSTNSGGTFFNAANTAGGFAKLEISGNATSVATLSFTNSLSITGGATSFSSSITTTQLNAYGASNSNVIIAGVNSGTNAPRLFVQADESTNTVKVLSGSSTGSDNMAFGVGGATNNLYIKAGGNVLIGTTTDLGAGYKLQVNGSISMAYANFFNFKGSSGAGDVIVDNSGSSLRVTGLAKFDSTVTFTTTTFFEGLLTNYNVYNTQTSSYTLVLSDASKIIEMNVGSANTVTIPTNASVAFPIGTEITVLQYGGGVTSIAVAGGVSIISKDNANIIANRYTGVTLIKRATNEWYIIGNVVV